MATQTTKMGSKCNNNNMCGNESFLQCVKIDGNKKVSDCNKESVDCGSDGSPQGVCYPLSIAPTTSAVNMALDQIQKEKEGKDGSKNKELLTTLAIVGGSIGGIIIIGFIGKWVVNKINAAKTQT